MIKKKTYEKVFLVVFLGFCLSIVGISQKTEEPGVLLRSAIEKEEVDGDLQGAIDIYQKIIEEFSSNQAIAAQAQLRIGMCLEKLGLHEAQNAYQKVIENYPLQYEEVNAAKERISLLAKTLKTTPDKSKFRKIHIPANPGNGVLSPDGKRLAFASEGSIWVAPIPGKVDPSMAGTPLRLTEPMAAENSSNTLTWSGDGKWIAFNTFTVSQNSICIVPSSGGEVKKIPVETRGNVFRRRLSLSPDGKILAFCNVFGDSVGLYSVSVEGGKVQRLTDSPSLGNLQPAFSPDGKKLAYVEVFRLEKGIKSSIWVIGSRGGTPVKIGDYIGTTRGPVWSPDNTMISFILDPLNRKSNEIYIIPLRQTDSEPSKPVRIELPQLKRTFQHPAGWTTQNSIGLYLENPSEDAVYTVPSSGGRATQISPACKANHPRWSPDGKRIFFRRGQGISSVPSDGGPITSLIPSEPNYNQVWEATAGGGNNISPDGKKLVFSGVKSVGKRDEKDFHIELRIFTIPVKGGSPMQITDFPWNPDIASQDRFPCWSPDGKWIAFTRDMVNEKRDWWGYNIFIVPSGGGEPRQITTESHRLTYAAIDWSPDGKHIAYFTQNNTIDFIPVEGGLSKTLVKVDKVDSHWELSWSPDGRKIAYSCQGRIYTVQVEGGQPIEVKTGLGVEASNLSWSPDGKTIAFIATKSEPPELWLMENFLSEIDNKKKVCTYRD